MLQHSPMMAFLLLTWTVWSGSAGAQCIVLENQIIPAPPGSVADRFGYSVAVQSSLLVVGRPIGNALTGSVDVFSRQSGTWIAIQELVAVDAASSNLFGDAVAVDRNRIIVGSPGDDGNGVNHGSAYLFQHDGTQWVQEQKIVNPAPLNNDFFANAVALEGNVAAVGTEQDNGNFFLQNSGTVRIYRHDGSAWQQTQTLKATLEDDFDQFGHSCAIHADTLIVGQLLGEGLSVDSGAAYVYRDNGSSFTLEQQIFASDGSNGDEYGRAVAINGDVAVVGASHADHTATSSGAAYVYRRNGTTWTEEQRLEAAAATAQDFFGTSVAVNGDRILVGAHEHSPPGSTGFAYLYQYTGSQWVEVQKLLASDAVDDDAFGWQVALNEDQAFSSSRDADGGTGSPDTGALYAYYLTDLALDSNLDSAGAGDTLTFTTCGGLDVGIAMLFVTAINATPLFVRVATGSFDATGQWTFGGPVPSGLSGVIATFRTFGFYQPGKIGSSGERAVSFL
jgi:hypothetical protein